MMGAGGLPGEAVIESFAASEIGRSATRSYHPETVADALRPVDARFYGGAQDAINILQALLRAALVPAADSAAALRAVLREPEAREALREMLTSEAAVYAAWRARFEKRWSDVPMRHALDAAVDALASGVEGGEGTEGEKR